jgi:hypothetical protein
VTDSEIIEVLGTYPDRTADALQKWKVSTLERERYGSKLYLDLKARAAGGEKVTVKELEMMVEADEGHYKARLEEIMAESDHLRCYEKLLSAKKMAGIRAGF